MAFALTDFIAYGDRQSDPVEFAGVQSLYFAITGTAADVAVAIGDYSSQFWIDALADATYGSLASGVKSYLQSLDDVLLGACSVQSPQIIDRVQVAALTGAAQYTLSINSTSKLPVITFNAGDGETSYGILVKCLMASTTQAPQYRS